MIKRSRATVEVVLRRGDLLGGKLIRGDVDLVATLEVEHRVANAGRLLPTVVLVLEEAVEEAAQILDVRLVVVVGPFLGVVDAQPLLFCEAIRRQARNVPAVCKVFE